MLCLLEIRLLIFGIKTIIAFYRVWGVLTLNSRVPVNVPMGNSVCTDRNSTTTITFLTIKYGCTSSRSASAADLRGQREIALPFALDKILGFCYSVTLYENSLVSKAVSM